LRARGACLASRHRTDSVVPMPKFTYGNFSEEAREAVLTAENVALVASSEKVLPEHLEAAINGAMRSERPGPVGGVPFDLTTREILEQAHDAAVSAGEDVELHHLGNALSDR
jgi:hypothetical protein